MLPPRECPVCSGELVGKEVQKLLKGGNDTAVLKVRAEVCLRCGERLYSSTTVRQFEEIRKRLKTGQAEEFTPIGQSFQIR